ncbi:two-component system, LuxR family, sensor histidine kinase TtrS [Ferrimonas sediminum]|uniref:histidine kinase n=1 Tax=Ferrimonas sediminum TaxID=718193 RepID=A0A1G8X702_9GAMM|nr:two-component system, LuxR family, sensor histidine kinase TtrS [Ferrimonas sediminum]
MVFRMPALKVSQLTLTPACCNYTVPVDNLLRDTVTTRLITLVCFALLLAAPQAMSREPVRMAVLAFDAPDKVRQRWQPTVDYLNAHLDEHKLVLLALRPHQVDRLVQHQSFDFFIGNAVKSLQLKQGYGSSQLLSLKPLGGRDPAFAVGSAIVTRQGHQVDNLQSLRSQRLVSVSQQAFGGFIAFWRELDQQGLHPLSDFPFLKFVGFPQSKLLHQVASGNADAAIVPTCLLERMESSGQLPKGKLSVALPLDIAGPCVSSTRLYPYSSLSKMGHTSNRLARQVARLLLDLEPGSPAANVGRYEGWTVPVDDSHVYALLKEIRLWPFNADWRELWPEVTPYLLGLMALLMLGYIHHLRVRAMVTRRTAQLQQEMADHRQTQEELEQQQRGFYKAQRVLLTGEMASGIAHELNQPLASIRYLTQGCQYRLESESLDKGALNQGLDRIADQTDRAREIIRKLREFCARSSHQEPVELSALVTETLALMAPDCRHNRCQIELKQPVSAGVITGDPTLLQQVLVNLMRNGMEAMLSLPEAQRRLEIALTHSGDELCLSVRDRGPGLSDAKLARLFLPFESDKPDGLGLGMTICKRIVEEHNGRIEAQRQQPGLALICHFPLRSTP